MATTGFWPVKSRLKELIDYADNPDKTTDRRYLDADLAATLNYVGNDAKTDQTMYVSAINCPPQRAYECMTATKRRYGKPGGNVAYHGYQSFVAGEVTPEEAHAIGKETAKRMWGDDYEIVVTTHLNTDNIHNHIVVNSVSFRTGRKFENHVSDHYKLREISDRVCAEHNKSVLPPSKFTGNHKKDYWIHKNGGISHRDILKADIEDVIKRSGTLESFRDQLRERGYIVERTEDRYAHITVRLPEWKRPLRLDTLGYTEERIRDRITRNWDGYNAPKQRLRKVKYYPMLSLEKQLEFEVFHSNDTATVLIDVLILILLELIRLTKDIAQAELGNRALTPAIRYSATLEKQLTEEYFFLKNNGLHTEKEIVSFENNVTEQIATLERERQDIRNRNRHPKSKEESDKNKAAARAVSEKLKPLRDQQKLAKRVLDRYPQVWELLKTEHEAERKARDRNLARNREWSR